jgi:hypothetical protein
MTHHKIGSLSLFILLVAAVLAAGVLSGAAPPPQPGGQGVFSGWNIRYTVPPSWTVARIIGRSQVLASQAEPGIIFLGAGMYRTAEEAIADLAAAYRMLNLQAMPVEPPQRTTIGGFDAVVATYVSVDQSGRQVQGRYLALFTRYGTGLNMLAMTTPELMPKLRDTLDVLASTVKASEPAVNADAVAALAGSWIYYAGAAGGGSRVTGGTSNSYEETVVFDGRGGFRWQSSASVSADASGYAGSAGQASANNDQGTYTVIGTSIVFKGARGQVVVDFELQANRLALGGKVFGRQ